MKEIKEKNIVVNFSSMEIPNTVYLYLAKGLNYIPVYKGDKSNLKYDAMEFVRKLAWKHYFAQIPDNEQTEDNALFRKLKVSSHNYPATSHPLLEEKDHLFSESGCHRLRSPLGGSVRCNCEASSVPRSTRSRPRSTQGIAVGFTGFFGCRFWSGLAANANAAAARSIIPSHSRARNRSEVSRRFYGSGSVLV